MLEFDYQMDDEGEIMYNDLTDSAIDRMLDDITEAYWADTDEDERMTFSDYTALDAYEEAARADWYEYCDEASDGSFPTITTEV